VRLRNDQMANRSYPRTTGEARPFRFEMPAPRLLGIAAVIGLTVFIAAFTVPDLIHQNRQEQAATLVERALGTYAASQQEQDPARKRVLLEETRRLAAEALRLEPADLSAAELRNQAGAALTALDAIVDLGPMATVTTLAARSPAK
jgi:hypothetical protein